MNQGVKSPEEIKSLVERSANEDWSFAMLASEIGHSEPCAKQMALAHFCGQPLKCQCPEKND